MTDVVQTPRCPDCDRVPALLLADGHQAFCQTPDCLVITWDTFLTADENRARASVVDLEGLDHE